MKLTQRLTSILTSTVLVTVVVTSGVTTAFAEESGEDLIITETQEKQVTKEDTVEEVTNEKEAVTEEEVESEVGLIPGDFFYFVELMQEKIQLALTINEFEKSQLLAEFAAERIAEANSLIKQEKYEEAGELLRTALEYQEKAEVTLEADNVNDVMEEAGTEVEAEGEETTTEEDGTVDEATVVTDEEVTEDVVEESSEAEKVKVKLANNITALSAVLAKIDNPKAQAAIMKNIEKSFAKLAKKIEKRANKLAENEIVVDKETTTETDKTQEKETLTVEAPVSDEKTDLSNEGKSNIVKENNKAEKKAEKAQQKEERKAKKAEEKAKKVIEKAEKKAKKQEHKGNQGKGINGHGKGSKGQGNGKGNGHN